MPIVHCRQIKTTVRLRAYAKRALQPGENFCSFSEEAGEVHRPSMGTPGYLQNERRVLVGPQGFEPRTKGL